MTIPLETQEQTPSVWHQRGSLGNALVNLGKIAIECPIMIRPQLYLDILCPKGHPAS
jgi:hypothetical protein